jgi:hypothetical protein
MSIEQEDTIDFVTIDKATGKVWLTISDHLPWLPDEDIHLALLQNKLNSYLRFIESGEIISSVPDAKGREIVIKLIAKFPLSEKANSFFEKARLAIKNAGLRLEFALLRPN